MFFCHLTCEYTEYLMINFQNIDDTILTLFCFCFWCCWVIVATSVHYSDVMRGTMASQITSLTIVYSTVYSGADKRKYHTSVSPAFVWGNHRVTGEFPAQRASNAEFFFYLLMSSWSALMICSSPYMLHICRWLLLAIYVGTGDSICSSCIKQKNGNIYMLTTWHSSLK